MASKEAQINIRLPVELDEWVESRAGGKREKPSFVRGLLERERAREEEDRLLKMFDSAWDSLSAEEKEEVRGEREDWVGVHPGTSRA